MNGIPDSGDTPDRQGDAPQAAVSVTLDALGCRAYVQLSAIVGLQGYLPILLSRRWNLGSTELPTGSAEEIRTQRPMVSEAMFADWWIQQSARTRNQFISALSAHRAQLEKPVVSFMDPAEV